MKQINLEQSLWALLQYLASAPSLCGSTHLSVLSSSLFPPPPCLTQQCRARCSTQRNCGPWASLLFETATVGSLTRHVFRHGRVWFPVPGVVQHIGDGHATKPPC